MASEDKLPPERQIAATAAVEDSAEWQLLLLEPETALHPLHADDG